MYKEVSKMDRRGYYRQEPYTHWPNTNNPGFYPQSPYSGESQHFPVKQPTPYELYAKPEQPMDWFHSGKQTSNPTEVNSSFTDNNGQMEFDKLLSSINQVASTYHQVSPIVKQLSSLIRMFRQ